MKNTGTNKKINMDEILIAVYVKIPSGTTAQKIYENLMLAAIVDVSTGIILKSELTLSAEIAKNFFYEMLNGANLNEDIEQLVYYVERKYFGHLKKSLITAMRMLSREYKVIAQSRK